MLLPLGRKVVIPSYTTNFPTAVAHHCIVLFEVLLGLSLGLLLLDWARLVEISRGIIALCGALE